MNEENRNDLQEILTQALNEMKEESGEKFNINKVNLAELERRTGISRGKLRRLKANKFVVKPHGLSGRTSNNNVTEAFSGDLPECIDVWQAFLYRDAPAAIWFLTLHPDFFPNLE